MKPDRMSVRLHLRRMRAIGVVVDLIERLVVAVVDVRRWGVIDSVPEGATVGSSTHNIHQVTCP